MDETCVVAMPDGIVMGQVIVMPDGIAMVQVIVMCDGIAMPGGIVMVQVIDIVVAEDRCMVQLGDMLDAPVGPGLAFAGAARTVREIVAAAKAAAAMRRGRMVLSSAGRGLGDRVRGIRHIEIKASYSRVSLRALIHSDHPDAAHPWPRSSCFPKSLGIPAQGQPGVARSAFWVTVLMRNLESMRPRGPRTVTSGLGSSGNWLQLNTRYP
ncbi:hypothetical protein [Streptomyces sp. WAC00263]|uniref:hypothetical protein n=1 Tax=Streptomyces sp. WAC00263 TaxID=1917422 RepID=UPI0015EFBD73|nr:hypothetical protein [Streptomyces sp. WAC00263]KAF5999125.1 hypothetical protein BOG92_052565 [Streptomyces sp. WAC00263]